MNTCASVKKEVACCGTDPVKAGQVACCGTDPVKAGQAQLWLGACFQEKAGGALRWLLAEI